MEDSKIVLKNWENGEKFSDFFNPNQQFDITNKVAYCFGEHLVSPAEAIRRGFEVDKKFQLPFGYNDRIKAALYVQEVLGITRVSNPALYFKTWKQLSEGLPQGDVNELRPHTNR
jgi:hypothetical protein